MSEGEIRYQLEYPQTKLNQVILPDEMIRRTMNLIDQYDTMIDARTRLGLPDAIDYGRATVILFEGPSGAGKTMFARAISNHLQKPLVTPRFSQSGSAAELLHATESIESFFAEVERRGGIALIDECEELCSIESAHTSDFLRAIEKHEIIVLMTTSHGSLIDPAMERRISLRLTFSYPSAAEREAIWKSMITPNIRLSEDLDFHIVAKLYPTTGGKIKNAFMYALNLAIQRDPEHVVLSMIDIDEAFAATELCPWTERGVRRLIKLDHRWPPFVSSERVRMKADELTEKIRRWPEIVRRVIPGNGMEPHGPKILVTGRSRETSLRVACYLAASLSPVACTINIASIREQFGRFGFDLYSGQIDTLLTNHRAAGNPVLVESAELLLGKHLPPPSDSGAFELTVLRILLEHPHTVIFVSSLPRRLISDQLAGLTDVIDVDIQDTEDTAMFWSGILDQARITYERDLPETLARQFDFKLDDIRRIVLEILWHRPNLLTGEPMTEQDVRDVLTGFLTRDRFRSEILFTTIDRP